MLWSKIRQRKKEPPDNKAPKIRMLLNKSRLYICVDNSVAC